MNEKYAIMTPFDITSKILGPYLFSPTARETLGEKMELYFQDHSFVPLFIQVSAQVKISLRNTYLLAGELFENPTYTRSKYGRP